LKNQTIIDLQKKVIQLAALAAKDSLTEEFRATVVNQFNINTDLTGRITALESAIKVLK
jgi:hypothetical protein